MKLTYTNKKFIMECTFHEKDIPKKAGFRWNPSEKHWWTDKATNANKIVEFANEEAKKQIEINLNIHQEKIIASKATNANIEIPIPNGLSYLPFQKGGIAYAMDKENVLIGDEMGLGKTIQAIGVINGDTNIKTALIIVPASLRLNWKNELQKWLVRSFSISVIESKNGWENADIIIINYDILKKHHNELRAIKWDIMIVDECHYLKNSKALRTKQVFGFGNKNPEKIIHPIEASKKIFLTGTPIVNRPIEMFPMLRHCNIFQSWKYYVTKFCDGHQNRYGWDVSGASNLDELQEELRTKIMVRRLKKDVLKDLPAKQRQIIELPTNGAITAIQNEKEAQKRHNELIENLKIAVELAKVSDNENEYQEAVQALGEANSVAFTEMSKLRRQTALTKVPYVVEHVREAIDSSGKIVLFAHHKDVVKAIENEFENVAVLVGDTSMENRQVAIEKFQNDPDCKLFIGSIKAAGVGITLTASSHVIFAELDWVPGNLSQAEDRCHRIGQENSVLIQHLVLAESIDSIMAKMIVEKQKVIDSALDDEHEIDNSQIQVLIETVKEQAASKEKSRAKIEKEAEKLATEEIELIHFALNQLSAYCDGAQAEDGMGFNKIDTRIGKSLAVMPKLTPKQAVLGKTIIKKYKRQINEKIYTKIF